MKLFIVLAVFALSSNADVSFPTLISVGDYRAPFNAYGAPEFRAPLPALPPQIPASVYGAPAEVYGLPIVRTEPEPIAEPPVQAPEAPALLPLPEILKPILKEEGLPAPVYGIPQEPIVKSEVVVNAPSPVYGPVDLPAVYNAPFVAAIPEASVVPAPVYGAPIVKEEPIIKTEVLPEVISAPYPAVQELPIAKVEFDAPYPAAVEDTPIKPEVVYGTPIEPVKLYVEPAPEPFFVPPTAPELPPLPEISQLVVQELPVVDAPYPAAVDAPYPAAVEDTPIKPELVYGTPIVELPKIPEPIVQELPIAKVEINAPYPAAIEDTPIKPEVVYGTPVFEQEAVVKSEPLPAPVYGLPIVPVAPKIVEVPEKIIDAPYPAPLPFASHYGEPTIKLASLFK